MVDKLPCRVTTIGRHTSLHGYGMTNQQSLHLASALRPIGTDSGLSLKRALSHRRPGTRIPERIDLGSFGFQHGTLLLTDAEATSVLCSTWWAPRRRCLPAYFP